MTQKVAQYLGGLQTDVRNILAIDTNTHSVIVGAGTSATANLHVVGTGFLSTNLVIGTNIGVSAGSPPSPGYRFFSDIDTGFYSNAADTLGVAAGGIGRFNFSTTALLPTTNITYNIGSAAAAMLNLYGANLYVGDGSAANPGIKFIGSIGTGIYKDTPADTFAIATAGTKRFTINASHMLAGVIRGSNASVGGPTYSFNDDATTGFGMESAPQTVAVSTAGSKRLSINSTAIQGNVVFYATSGINTAPGYAFTNGTSTGIFYKDTNQLAFTVGGNEAANIVAADEVAYFKYVTMLEGSAPDWEGTYVVAQVGDYEGSIHKLQTGDGIGLGYDGGRPILFANTQGVLIDSALKMNLLGNFGWFSSNTAFVGLSSNGHTIFAEGGSNSAFSWERAKVTFYMPALFSLGSAANPSVSFDGDTNTGIYRSSADVLGFSTGGTARIVVSNTNTTFNHGVTTAVTTLTDALTLSWDLSTGNRFIVQFGNSTARTLSAPSNMTTGQSFEMVIKSGGGTLAYNSYFKFSTTPVLGANTNLLFGTVVNATFIASSMSVDIH